MTVPHGSKRLLWVMDVVGGILLSVISSPNARVTPNVMSISQEVFPKLYSIYEYSCLDGVFKLFLYRKLED